MKPLLAILLLCSVAYAQRPPKSAPDVSHRPNVRQPAWQDRVPDAPPVPRQQQQEPSLLHGGSYQQPLSDQEYKLQKQRYAEYLVHKKAAARAGISPKSGKRRRTEGISVHDAYVNQAMEAVRQVQGR
jgi:hypothetical protein